MVGDGPLKTEIEEQASKLGIYDRITYAGYQRDVRPWIAMSNVLLLTSDTEGMPGVVLEAAAMSTLTISNIVGGIQEFIKSGENGILNNTNSVSEFCYLLTSLISDIKHIKKISEKSFETVSSKYHIETIYQSYLSFFTKFNTK